MKLVINIPCYNEEQTLPLVLRELPKKIPGITSIEVQIVDDGSKDDTIGVAKKFGVHRIVRHKKNLGLGVAFKHGVDAALAAGADILVNIDADHAHPPRYIPELVAPIVDDTADIVIGNRTPWKVKEYSAIKRFFQWFGNSWTRWLMDSDVPDTVSGFRAYSREALLRLNVTTKFSYVLDTIMQASKKGLVIKSVDIVPNKQTRPSRLFKNIFQHMYKSGINVLRAYVLYEPFKTFLFFSFLFFIPAMALVIRFAIYFYYGVGGGHLQSLLLAAVLLIFGGITFALGILAELIGLNRRLNEEGLYMEKKKHFST